jgi:hypothetical protein
VHQSLYAAPKEDDPDRDADGESDIDGVGQLDLQAGQLTLPPPFPVNGFPMVGPLPPGFEVGWHCALLGSNMWLMSLVSVPAGAPWLPPPPWGGMIPMVVAVGPPPVGYYSPTPYYDSTILPTTDVTGRIEPPSSIMTLSVSSTAAPPIPMVLTKAYPAINPSLDDRPPASDNN